MSSFVSGLRNRWVTEHTVKIDFIENIMEI